MQAGNPHLIRKYNRDIIKNLIISHGPITKPEIARITHLSIPTVNKIVGQMEQQGMICRDVISVGGLGRKAQSYSINKDSIRAIIIFCLNEQFHSCVTNAVGEKIMEKYTKIPGGSLSDSFGCLTEIIDGYMLLFGRESIQAIAVGVPGVVSEEGLISSIPMIPSWEQFALQETLEKQYRLPVFVDNDVNLMAVGYFYSEAVPACDSLVFIYGGKVGIGAGMILHQKLLRGYCSFAGELGYMTLFDADRDDTLAGPAGSLEKQYIPLSKKMAVGSVDQAERRAYLKLLTRVTANFIAMINPEVIAIRSSGILAAEIALIGKMLRNFVPGNKLPKLIAVENDQYGLRGAIHLCLSNISSNLTLVNQVGV